MATLKGIRRFWPAKLEQQIALILVLALAGSISLLTYKTYQSESQAYQNMLTREAILIAKNVAASGAHHLFGKHQSEINSLLKQSIENPGIMSVTVTDAHGRVIGTIRRHGTGLLINQGLNQYINTPAKADPVNIVLPDSIVIWNPVISNTLQGWINVTYSMDTLEQRKAELIRSTVIDGLMIIFVALALILALLRKPVKSIEKSAHFASQLDQQDGRQLETDDSAYELQILTESLNATSLKLHEQNLALEQNIKDLEDEKFALDQHSIVSITDTKGIIIYANDKFCDVSGYSRSELVGKTHTIVNSGLHDRIFFREMWQTISKGNVWHGEIRNRKRDGSYYWVQTTIVPFQDKSNKPYQYVAIRTEITRQKEYEDVLQRIAAFPKNNPGIVLSLTQDCELVYQNPTATEQLRQLRLKNEPVRKLFPVNIDSIIQECLGSGSDKTGYESKIVDHYWLWTFHPMMEQNVVHCYAVDITEKKKAEHALRTSEELNRQTQKLQAIGTMASGIAHDFNNILFSLFGYAELIEMEAEDNPEILANSRQMLVGLERARELIKQIQEFSREDPEEMQTFQPCHSTKEIVKLLAASIPASITIESDIECNNWVHINPSQYHQILMNLCINASQAIGYEQGTLSVILKSETLSEAVETLTGVLDPGKYLRLTVSDNGSGISPDVAPRIFDTFFTTRETGKGAGLGLPAVHGIVKNLQGGITYASKPGAGSVFNVFLPIVKAKSDKDCLANTG